MFFIRLLSAICLFPYTHPSTHTPFFLLLVFVLCCIDSLHHSELILCSLLHCSASSFLTLHQSMPPHSTCPCTSLNSHVFCTFREPLERHTHFKKLSSLDHVMSWIVHVLYMYLSENTGKIIHCAWVYMTESVCLREYVCEYLCDKRCFVEKIRSHSSSCVSGIRQVWQRSQEQERDLYERAERWWTSVKKQK